MGKATGRKEAVRLEEVVLAQAFGLRTPQGVLGAGRCGSSEQCLLSS